MSVAINYPFNLNVNGQLLSSSDPAKIWLDRVVTLLSTNIGQRPLMPEYGTDLSRALFENDSDIFKAVDKAVRSAIQTWLPVVQVSEVIVGEPGYDGISPVEIKLILPNNILTSLAVTTAIFHSDGSITK